MLAQIKENYSDDVRIVYRHFPLISIHDKAALSAQASEAAGMQGKFWEMHDLLFQRQGEWRNFQVEEFQNWLTEQATILGIDTDQFTLDMLNQATIDVVQATWDRGVEIGLPGTPFLLINGRMWPNNLPMSSEYIMAIIELELLERIQFSECPPMNIDPTRRYIATIETTKGDVALELFPDKAPLAVNNFIFLARSGWYEGVSFHRVIPGLVAQAGDPSGTGYGGPGYAFVNEIVPDLKFDRAGVLGMANSGPGTNGSQFFISLGPNPAWDGDYTIFGKVISGLDVVEQLTPRDPSKTLDLPTGDVITRVTIEEK